MQTIATVPLPWRASAPGASELPISMWVCYRRSGRLCALPTSDRHGWRPLLRIPRPRHLSILGRQKCRKRRSCFRPCGSATGAPDSCVHFPHPCGSEIGRPSNIVGAVFIIACWISCSCCLAPVRTRGSARCATHNFPFEDHPCEPVLCLQHPLRWCWRWMPTRLPTPRLLTHELF